VGGALSSATGRDYVDNDARIAEQAGLTTEALARLGGTLLHSQEAAYVRDLVSRRLEVIAGIPASTADQPELLQMLRRSGLLVYLHCRPGILAARVTRDAPRPWLSTSPDDVEQLLTGMYAARDAALRKAAHVILDGEAPVDLLHHRVLAALG
jgi:shikimate kinase